MRVVAVIGDTNSSEIRSATISQALNPCVIRICRFLSSLGQRAGIHSALGFFETCTTSLTTDLSSRRPLAGRSSHRLGFFFFLYLFVAINAFA
ncbi:uncharacterized protein [Physcomitrium patens]|uniref:uncharacterized protein isoform X2 n=1 Tax=Physcomitrium patens TaxID=3218 RepID=UPI003CCCEF76